MKFGLCTIADKDAPVEDVLAAAAEAGYDGVDVWGQDHVGDRSPETCGAIREAAEDRGLEIAVFASYLRPGGSNYEAEVEDELATAERLGASLIRVWAGDQEYQDRSAEHWNRTVEDTIDLAERAAERGLGVTVEKHEGTLTNTGEGARRFVEEVDRENCGLNWQPLFGLPAEEIVAEARDLAPLSNNVHVQAVPEVGESWRNRCLLEDAHFDVAAALEPFADGEFDGYVEVEFVTEDLDFETAIRRDLEYLESAVN